MFGQLYSVWKVCNNIRNCCKRSSSSLFISDRVGSGMYLFGAICPARGVGAALALPYADAEMMQLHLDEISRNVAEGAHAVLLLDQATHATSKLDVPGNITPIFLPFRAPGAEPRRERTGSISARTGSQTPSSKTMTRSSTPHAPLGKSSSLNPKRSPPSECAIGLMSVSHYDPWYNAHKA